MAERPTRSERLAKMRGIAVAYSAAKPGMQKPDNWDVGLAWHLADIAEAVSFLLEIEMGQNG